MKQSRQIGVLIVCAFVLILTAPYGEVCGSEPGDVLALIRNARGDNIATDVRLTREAESRAREIVADFSHAGANHPYAEILAWNAYPEEFTEGAAVHAWLGSPGHAAILLDMSYTQIGVATLDAAPKHFYVALFAHGTTQPAPRQTLPPTDTEVCE